MRPLIAILLVALVGCGDDTASTTTTTAPEFDPAQMVQYVSDRHGFAIAYPPDWIVTEVDVENLVGFTSPTVSTLTPNFNITVNDAPEGLPAAAYYEGEIERVTASLENAEILEVVDVNVDGVVGRGLTLVTRQQGLDIGISRIIVLRDSKAYELSFFAEASDLERLAPMVASIFQSLRFLS
ncbi:MAG TPA: PsbP-related protein [Acidimicrobiia bacterium]|nr:PsbP-related protein [Acidimicrobiia bacterium]